jgi:hypothetical protein
MRFLCAAMLSLSLLVLPTQDASAGWIWGNDPDMSFCAMTKAGARRLGVSAHVWSWLQGYCGSDAPVVNQRSVSSTVRP